MVVVISHKQIPEKRSSATFVDDGDICSIVVLIKGGCKNHKTKQCLLECDDVAWNKDSYKYLKQDTLN